jgi:hypothetical protein
MESFGKFTLAVIGLVISTMFRGFILSVLWGWFMVPIFNLPVLAIAPAIGLSVIVTFLTASLPDEKSERSFSFAIGYSLVFSALSLLIGYVVTLFM